MKFLLWPQKWFSFKEESPQKKINLILATEKSSTLLILQCAFHGISVTKDDHFPVVILKLHFKSTWNEILSNDFSLSLSTLTMMLLLNRHLTRYKWYFVSFTTHGGMWFVCDKCNWLCGCFLHIWRAIKGYWKCWIFMERSLCAEAILSHRLLSLICRCFIAAKRLLRGCYRKTNF